MAHKNTALHADWIIPIVPTNVCLQDHTLIISENIIDKIIPTSQWDPNYYGDQIEEVRDLALPELFEGNSVTLIEWGDQIISALPKDHLEISFEYADADNDRFITIRANGSEWNSRVTELKNSLGIKGLLKC